MQLKSRAIAPIVGVGMTTVKRDIAGGPSGPPDPIANPLTAELLDYNAVDRDLSL